MISKYDTLRTQAEARRIKWLHEDMLRELARLNPIVALNEMAMTQPVERKEPA